MNQEQINQVKATVETYFTLDVKNIMAETYKSKESLNSVMIGEFTTQEIVNLLNKVFTQFKQELNDTYAKSLPFQYNFQNEFGNGNCQSDLNQLIVYIQNKQFENIPTFLNRVIHYQAVNGFWEKSKRKYFSSKEENLIEEIERIKLISKHLELLTSDSESIFTSIREKEEHLDNFIMQKQSQLSEIESLLSAARQHANELNELHSKAVAVAERIGSLGDSSSEKEQAISELLKVISRHQNDSERLTSSIKAFYDEYVERLEMLHDSYEKKLDIVSSQTLYFEERNEYLNDLIGREVGVSLFETFKQRKKELIPSVRFWKWSVPIMTVATIFWIFFLFGNGDLSEITLEVFAINSLKTLPALFLLLFSITQYSKERHFQEEYAFKSAVALTINAYADQLKDASNKDKLIMDSVSEIYKTPIETPVRKGNDSKAAIETAKGLADVAKGLVNR